MINKSFDAKFAGSCGMCPEGIKVGQSIVKSGPRYVHTVCRQFMLGQATTTDRARVLRPVAGSDGRQDLRGVSWESVVEGNEGWDGETEIALAALNAWMIVNPGNVERRHRELEARWMREVESFRVRYTW